MGIRDAIFNRVRRLLGDEAMVKLDTARVIIFGVGGVGSWCAESLVRSGIRHLTIVDSDCVCVTNINRQLMANTSTVGMVKVEALRDYLLKINPEAEIVALRRVYCEETADEFDFNNFDFVIDAIDSLKDKALLIERATAAKTRLYSSMGAALKLDPTRVRVAEFWKVKGCPLARALRDRFKRTKHFPKKKFLCVYSDELLSNTGEVARFSTEHCRCPKVGNEAEGNDERCSGKACINGSLQHITAIFGLTLAGLVIKKVVDS